MVEHISYSAWMLFRRGCQWRWKLDYLEGRRSKDESPHMDFGTAIHETIELYRNRRPNPYATIEFSVFFFREKFRWLYGSHFECYRPIGELENEKRCPKMILDEDGTLSRCFHWGKHKGLDHEPALKFFFRVGENILRRLDECDELREAEVVFNEHELMVSIDRVDLDIKFKGFIDLTIKTKDKRKNTILYICDLKTCGWGWDREKREDKNLHFQILLYKHFLCKKFDLDPKMVRTAFILLKKKPRPGDCPIEFFPISAGPVSVQRSVDELNRDITQMIIRSNSGDFRKNLDLCSNDFGDVCPYLTSPLCPK